MFGQEKTTQELIDQKNHYYCDAVKEVKSLVLSGDLQQINWQSDLQNGYLISSLVELAVAEMADTPAAKAVFDIAVQRIRHRDKTVPDAFAGEFAIQCVQAAKSDNNSLDEKFIESLRSQDVDNYSLALFWITTVGEYNSRIFGYEQEEINREHILEPELLFALPAGLQPRNIFEEIILDLTDKDMLKLLQQYSNFEVYLGRSLWNVAPLQAMLARDRPEVISQFISSLAVDDSANYAVEWPYINTATEAFDEQCIEFCSVRGLCYPLMVLDGLRRGKHTELALKISAAADSPTILPNAGFIMPYLLQKDPRIMLQHLIYVSSCYQQVSAMPWYECYECAFDHWEAGGKEACMQGGVEVSSMFLQRLIESRSGNENLIEWIRRLWTFSAGGGYQQEKIREQIMAFDPLLVEEQLWGSLQSQQKGERSSGVAALMHNSIENVVDKAEKLLEGKVDARLGAVELLTAVGNEKAVSLLKSMLDSKQSARVSKSVIDGLEKLGKGPSLDDLDEKESDPNILATIEAAQIKPLPKTAGVWVDLSGLPALHANSGKPLSEKAITHLIAAQAKHKSINPAPDSMPVLQHIDREKSADFAIGLLNQWLASEQHVSGKWALTLAGVLGDKRILPVLTDPISGWTENSRHKLAEYAAQAVALVPADESLMILDTLASRYSRRYRNIGKACRAALELAAQNQNVSMDELADMIVPTLDFDSDYQRALPETEIRAVLQPDFKLTFYNPETESETKSPLKSLPPAAVEEIKTLRKLIREVVKGQTARLEQSLVRQRAWPLKRWQELFELNPFLQSYAATLVWASLDNKGSPRSLFRRYPNGLLANADGELIELESNDHSIVIAHPLNLGDKKTQLWREHFKRLKVKQPFAQLERPVALLDESQGNRKTLGLTENHKMANGTFRSRSEKLGWSRGSVVDGGGISSYYKDFPGVQVTAILMIEFMYIGQDPADEVTLLHTLFVKAESVEIGSYVYDEPRNVDDPRVVAFRDLPAVVYSEVLTDLQAIVA